MQYISIYFLLFSLLNRKLDCFTRQMQRSDPLILSKIVAGRLRKRKRAQTIPDAVLKLAKDADQFDYEIRETVENDDDIILDDNPGEIEDDDINIRLDGEVSSFIISFS